ncbi:hypothetical protein [Aquimarina sp. RZ0]|uniref:hypothetical protein n=1 Tax=Aquimarina sp. RZ0 TaxID=2607730 RepID=UPI0011F3762D|nr:hypothetical protein [Aquimarina sp. RZ0]KAA1243053.1 hypothetical protein F0000_22845 [Aquimarina sp. RZ0]
MGKNTQLRATTRVKEGYEKSKSPDNESYAQFKKKIVPNPKRKLGLEEHKQIANTEVGKRSYLLIGTPRDLIKALERYPDQTFTATSNSNDEQARFVEDPDRPLRISIGKTTEMKEIMDVIKDRVGAVAALPMVSATVGIGSLVGDSPGIIGGVVDPAQGWIDMQGSWGKATVLAYLGSWGKFISDTSNISNSKNAAAAKLEKIHPKLDRLTNLLAKTYSVEINPHLTDKTSINLEKTKTTNAEIANILREHFKIKKKNNIRR